MGANDIFWASGWICLALIAMVWLCRRAGSGRWRARGGGLSGASLLKPV